MERSIFDIQAEFCKAMGNATRLEIMHILRERPMTVTELMERTECTQSAVSRHLAVLRSVSVVRAERRGNEMLYQLTDEKISEVCDLVQKVLVDQTERQSNALSNM